MNNNVNANNINGLYAVSSTIEYPNYIYNESSDISCITYTIDTTANNITIPEMPSHNHVIFSSVEQPGFLVEMDNNEDVLYSHEETTEALKEHFLEKKLRKEHKMLEKVYKEYKMLARLLQIEEDEENC